MKQLVKKNKTEWEKYQKRDTWTQMDLFFYMPQSIVSTFAI